MLYIHSHNAIKKLISIFVGVDTCQSIFLRQINVQSSSEFNIMFVRVLTFWILLLHWIAGLENEKQKTMLKQWMKRRWKKSFSKIEQSGCNLNYCRRKVFFPWVDENGDATTLRNSGLVLHLFQTLAQINFSGSKIFFTKKWKI